MGQIRGLGNPEGHWTMSRRLLGFRGPVSGRLGFAGLGGSLNLAPAVLAFPR